MHAVLVCMLFLRLLFLTLETGGPHVFRAGTVQLGFEVPILLALLTPFLYVVDICNRHIGPHPGLSTTLASLIK